MRHVISASIAHNTTLANTNNRRINNKLDTRAENGLEMKPNQSKVTNKNATAQTSQHQTHRSGFRVRYVTRCRSKGSVWRKSRVESLWRARESQRARPHRRGSGDLHIVARSHSVHHRIEKLNGRICLKTQSKAHVPLPSRNVAVLQCLLRHQRTWDQRELFHNPSVM